MYIRFVACQVLQCISVTNRHMSKHTAEVLYGFSFSMISAMILFITVLIAMALYMFIKIVSRTQQKQNLNIAPILL